MEHNLTLNTTDIERVLPARAVSLFASFTFASCSLIGTISNLITIIALLKSKLREQTTTKFVVNLAICDLVLCAVPFPLYARQYASEQLLYPYQDILLPMLIIRWVFGSSGLDFLIAITVNRYVKICQGRYYDSIFSKRNVWILIAFIWIVRLVFGLVFLNGGLVYLKATGDHKQFSIFGDHAAISIIFMAQVFIPPPILIGCSVAMVRKMKNYDEQNNSFGIHTNHESKLVKISIIIVVFYVASVTPNYTVNIISRLVGSSKIQSIMFQNFHLLCFMLLGVNVIVNPFIYVYMSQDYRKAFHELFKST